MDEILKKLEDLKKSLILKSDDATGFSHQFEDEFLKDLYHGASIAYKNSAREVNKLIREVKSMNETVCSICNTEFEDRSNLNESNGRLVCNECLQRLDESRSADDLDKLNG